MLVNIDLEQYREYHEIMYQVKEKCIFEDEIKTYYKNRHLGIEGDKLPWCKLDQLVGLRHSELTIWAGENGSGKSLILGQIKLSLLKANKTVLTASLEMTPTKTLSRMVRQAIGSLNVSNGDIEQFMSWKKDKAYLFDHQGRLDAWQAIALCRYAKQHLKCEHIILDSMMKLVRGEDDFNGQKDLVDALCDVAKETKMHIHLVHHIRKGGESNRIAEKKDIKGSGVITDLADNVILIARNRLKEKETEQNRIADNTQPDTFLITAKQRNGDWEGTLGLWFDKKSQQFTESFQQPIINYLEEM
jgi:twinkle protein